MELSINYQLSTEKLPAKGIPYVSNVSINGHSNIAYWYNGFDGIKICALRTCSYVGQFQQPLVVVGYITVIGMILSNSNFETNKHVMAGFA